MRIISGKYKGRRIHPPTNFRARPTTDFARESLFNILNNYFDFEGLEVLDLFAGTGSIGFEFASRGARHVEMIDKNFIHAEFMKETARSMGMENVRIIKSDVFRYIEKQPATFDIVFADPPYDLENFEEVPVRILESHLLSEGGWFILEHSKSHSFSHLPGYSDHRNYGSVNFSIFHS